MQITADYIYNSAILLYNGCMEFDFSKTDKPAETALISLKTVYVLRADRSYDVKKEEEGRSGYVALRTTEGCGNVTIEDWGSETVTANTLLFFEYSKIKRYYCEGDQWDFWWFEFSLGESLRLPLNRMISMKKVYNEWEDCNNCLEFLRKEDPASKALASATLIQLLYKWLFFYQKENFSTNPHQESVEKVIAYMRAHLSQNVSIDKLSKIAGLSERRFRQVFEDLTGKQPKKFFDALRMNMAEELLNNTSLPIADIAERLGFSSQFHFSRVFRHCHRMPPSDYRRVDGR